MTETVGSAVHRVSDRVAAAAERSGRPAEAVRIVAAVKGVDVGRIAEAVAAGITEIGENRAVDLRDKAEALDGDVRWHFLGEIQTNKVRLLDHAALVQSLDRAEEAAALERRARSTGRTWDVLIEVNVAGEASKQGIDPRGVDVLLDDLTHYPSVTPRGFMFVAPQAQNPEDVRQAFVEGRRLRERFEGSGLDELSMGMSDDFEVAVEEGATIVRLGRVIFGHRPSRPPGPQEPQRGN
jgi:pyridoxal phosphate enzyme (YggS family)